MPIRTKLSIAISLIVAIILTLNITFSHIHAINRHKDYIKQQMNDIAAQLLVPIDLISQTNMTIEDELAKRLHLAAQYAEQLLAPDIASITLDELRQIKDHLQLSDITLWTMKDGELQLQVSSNANDVSIDSIAWDRQMKELFHLQPVAQHRGHIADNFFAAPIQQSTNSQLCFKSGFYYSGKTDYLINPSINMNTVFAGGFIANMNETVSRILEEHHYLLEITVVDASTIGATASISEHALSSHSSISTDDHVILGSYQYKNTELDSTLVQQALAANTITFSDFTLDGKQLAKAYIPVHNHEAYVISTVIDKGALLAPITKQLKDHIIVTIPLLLIAFIASYFIAYVLIKPLKSIMQKVNAITKRQFLMPLEYYRSDELGLLATQVNTMGNHLYHYTEQLKKTNEELLNTKQYLQSLFYHTKDALHIIDLNFNIMNANQAFIKMFDYEQDEVIGMRANIGIDGQDEEKTLLNKVMASHGISNYETIMYTKHGMKLNVSVTMSVIKGEHGQPIALAAITRNITERKQNEAILHNIEKLSAVNQLAASFAHEIKNPLSTIKGFLTLNSGNPFPETHMKLVMQEIHHLDSIANEFLQQTKPERELVDPIHIYTLIHDIIILKETSGKLCDYSLTLIGQKHLPIVRGSTHQLKQLFVNLINNGMDAMPDGGELSISLELDNKSDLASQSIVIHITDHGVGMTEEELKRIGEPFYTNKKDGNGLGLLVCQQIIASHKGTLSFNSKLGKGTIVTVTLPILHKK